MILILNIFKTIKFQAITFNNHIEKNHSESQIYFFIYFAFIISITNYISYSYYTISIVIVIKIVEENR